MQNLGEALIEQILEKTTLKCILFLKSYKFKKL